MLALPSTSSCPSYRSSFRWLDEDPGDRSNHWAVERERRPDENSKGWSKYSDTTLMRKSLFAKYANTTHKIVQRVVVGDLQRD